MAKRIVWTLQAKRDLREIPKPVALQILQTLARYALTNEGDTKQLQGIDPPLLRLRAQNHRIFFNEDGDSLEIRRILDRKDAYR